MFKIPEYKGIGIYAIINTDNKKVYIGSSCKIRTRALAHSGNLKNGTHSCKQLNIDYKNGNNFVFIILEKLPSNESLLIHEYIYMLLFRDLGFNLYNRESWNQLVNHIAYHFLGNKRKYFEKAFIERFKKPYWAVKQHNSVRFREVLESCDGKCI
jgi:group I intron endonuclease